MEDEARVWLQNNKPVPHDEVPAEFGLTMTDWERMGRTPQGTEQRGRQ